MIPLDQNLLKLRMVIGPIHKVFPFMVSITMKQVSQKDYFTWSVMSNQRIDPLKSKT